MSTWLMVGSSPSAFRGLQAVAGLPVDATITCNGGIILQPTPTVYVATDMHATTYWAAEAESAQKAGTRLVTLKRGTAALKERNSDWYDEFLDLPGHGDPTPDRWGCFGYTGPLTLEYCLRHGATTVLMVGCDGYRLGGVADYAVEQQIKTRHSRTAQERTDEILAPGFRKRAACFPECRIVQYGDPCFVIDLPNWEVIHV